MKVIYKKPESLTDNVTIYCPGCGHGIVHKIIGEVIDELGIKEKTIATAPVGCAVLAYDYFNFDVTETAHGRGPAVATAIKRVLPDRIVFTYQGDGDLAAIGTAEIVHAAARGESITVIFINNAVYGMTKGLLSTLDAPAYIERTTIENVPEIIKTKRAIKKAFKYQIENKGFSLIEVLSTCPTNWKMSPSEALKWVGNVMKKYFPPGVYRDKFKEGS